MGWDLFAEKCLKVTLQTNVMYWVSEWYELEVLVKKQI